ncbi:MAG TPA: lipopolysaccharide heptosyltransferase family protein, partial [Planctomycetaceae bacterium]|nr:lipopolysaccharide heptosyltransferase family protein [Planctomycetaceae bacterium]
MWSRSDAPRIMIVRLSAIGDSILTLPVLNALRDHFPHARLSWLIADYCAPIVRGHESLDELVEVNRGWLKSPRTIKQVRRRLHDMRLDVTIDVQGLAKSALPAWLSGAKRRIGFSRADREGREFSTWLNNELVHPSALHVVDRNLGLLKPLGIDNPTVRFDVPEHPSEIKAASDFIESRTLRQGFVVLNINAAWLSKRWTMERFAQVAKYLADRYGLASVLPWGNEREREDAERVAAKVPSHAMVLPKFSLTQLGSLFRRARLFVGSDTGPLHLASAVGTRCIGLYGRAVDRSGVYGPQGIVICHNHTSSDDAMRRNKDNDAMRLISVDEVCQAC